MKFQLKEEIYLISVALILVSQLAGAQNLEYRPLGFEDKWNYSITPFILVPNVNGNIESRFLSSEYGIGKADFINTLKGTIMINAEVWRRGFFLAPSYIYNHNEINKDLWSSSNGDLTFNVNPVYKRHIGELIGGWRINLEDKIVFDPYLGLRFTYYEISGNFSLNQKINDFSESAQFWDPVLGMKIHYYPKPRIPIEFRGDIGGFGMGSEFTWSTFFNTGYAVATWMDIILGFGALGNSYETTNSQNDEVALESITYGFDLGLRFFIGGREGF